MQHHAFVIEAGAEEGMARALAFGEREFGLSVKNNPDVVTLKFGLLSVEDARRAGEIAAGAPLTGDKKLIVIAASRAYHEAQNALLKLFEEPPQNTYLFLVVPNGGMLLPTLKSRVQFLKHQAPSTKNQTISEIANEFIHSTREKRSALIKKLASGRDEDERRENRDEALALVNGIEVAAYHNGRLTKSSIVELLNEIQILRGHLHDRSAPLKMILEHLAIVVPRGLGSDRL